ncbi:uncharacterized protein LOC144121845 isoform X2 [Amblyomma americanum]
MKKAQIQPASDRKTVKELQPPEQVQPDGVDTQWSIAIATCLIAFFAVSTHSNLGFFYVSFLEAFGTDRRNASWPGSIYEIVGHLAGILVAVMRKFFSVFQIGLMGSIVLWIGLLAAVFAPDIPWMAVTFGVIHGAGVGVVLIAITVAIMTHFDKYRGLAAGMKYTGNSLSSLVLPKVLSMLRAAYSMRGTMLIYAGLCMNTTALMFFLREKRRPTSSVKNSNSQKSQPQRRRQEKQDEQIGTVANDEDVTVQFCDSRHGSISRRPCGGTNRRRGSIAGSIGADTGLTSWCSQEVASLERNEAEKKTRSCTVALLTNPTFYALVLGALTVDYTVTVVHGTIVDYARDKGVDRATAELSMTYCAPAIFLGRLLLPLAADKGLIGRTSLAAMSLASMAASALALPHTTSFVTYIIAQATSATQWDHMTTSFDSSQPYRC